MHIGSFAYTALSFAIALGILVFVHELGHFLVAKRVGVKVLRFSIGFGPIVARRVRGETEYALSALPLGGYVKMLGEEDESEPEAVHDPARAFHTQPLRRRSAIVFAGPAMNFLFAFLAYAALYMTVGVEMPSNTTRIAGVSQGLPAQKAGLQAGDRIVAIDGKPVETWEELSDVVRASGGASLKVDVEREGGPLEVTITPSLEENRTMFSEPAGKVYRIGVEQSHDWERVSPPRAVWMAGEQTVFATGTVLKGLLLMVTGHVPLKELGGPIAIAQATSAQARAGLRYFLFTLAYLSVNLGVINLFPIPGLDGGLLALFGIESVLRRPLRQQHRELAQQVGLLLLITLMVFVFYNDIHRLVQG
jgi:regulator of sigma E protease